MPFDSFDDFIDRAILQRELRRAAAAREERTARFERFINFTPVEFLDVIRD